MNKRALIVIAAGLVTLGATAGAQAQALSFPDLFALGGAAYEAKDWPRCTDTFVKAAEAATAERQAARGYFAAAACATAKGDKEAAFSLLDKAAAKGYRDIDHTESNPELAPLRQDPRWKAFVAGVQKRSAARSPHLNPELTKLYQEDQADRLGAQRKDPAELAKRDAERRQQVQEILAKNGSREGDDYYHAAIIFQRSETPEDLAKAHEFCLKALALDPEHPTVRWLAATTQDRFLMKSGKPQLYGTQTQNVEGKLALWEVDPSVTDEERAKWDAPSLAIAKKKIQELNERAPRPH